MSEEIKDNVEEVQIKDKPKRKYVKRMKPIERKVRVIKNPKFNYKLYFKVGDNKVLGGEFKSQKDIANAITNTCVMVNKIIKNGHKFFLIEKEDLKNDAGTSSGKNLVENGYLECVSTESTEKEVKIDENGSIIV